MVTLVNAARRAQGSSTLGWLNPALYVLYPAFTNDITSGDNRCLAGGIMGPRCCKEGFYAAPGWDPVTGLGTIDFERFKDTLMQVGVLSAGGGVVTQEGTAAAASHSSNIKEGEWLWSSSIIKDTAYM